ncbi:TrbI/VirB10 family protein [Myxococcus llanfairpwllgwyngyllgogerychwyrndrobwllllantysiliogogogochensis]|uniref:TrbI/VirB10 family protein n=1 Tax=Myxococcus llanfairpwllgwyngyllgogerychwyrndrobwllllantysiliogogogochensis TaxID=2590453 RepID=UPI001C682994|nr:TrbI/VirB10 family protein [Myxococcus llanfairpwllgwyngyllgogerychwyrndrobwllllantysiliogogogochensis]
MKPSLVTASGGQTPGKPLPETPTAAPALPDVIRAAPDVPALPPAPPDIDLEQPGRPLPLAVAVKEPLVLPPGQSGGPLRGVVSAQAGTPEQQRQAELQLEQDLQARSSDLFFAGGGGGEESTGGSSLPMLGGASHGGAAQGGGSAAQGAGAGEDPNLQGRKIAFVESRSSNVGKAMTRAPPGPVVQAGTLIPVTLITGINSDLPGLIKGQVTSHVYDSVHGTAVMIPQGTTVLAKYDSMVAYGQERVLLCWDRLIRPDGSSVDLECMPGVDTQGYSGVADDVNNHWGRMATGVVLSTMLSAVTQAATGVGGINPSLPQQWAAGGAQAINSAGQRLTQKNMDVQPTITVRPGFKVNVLVSKDLYLSPYPTE